MKENDIAVLAVLAFGYLYMKKKNAAAVAYNASKTTTGAPVASMPGNVGTGWQQTASGAIAGFLQSLAKAPANATSQTVFPSYQTSDYGAVQDTVYAPQSVEDIIGANTDTTWWA